MFSVLRSFIFACIFNTLSTGLLNRNMFLCGCWRFVVWFCSLSSSADVVLFGLFCIFWNFKRNEFGHKPHGAVHPFGSFPFAALMKPTTTHRERIKPRFVLCCRTFAIGFVCVCVVRIKHTNIIHWMYYCALLKCVRSKTNLSIIIRLIDYTFVQANGDHNLRLSN